LSFLRSYINEQVRVGYTDASAVTVYGQPITVNHVCDVPMSNLVNDLANSRYWHVCGPSFQTGIYVTLQELNPSGNFNTNLNIDEVYIFAA
jgi:hypothetical protein